MADFYIILKLVQIVSFFLLASVISSSPNIQEFGILPNSYRDTR